MLQLPTHSRRQWLRSALGLWPSVAAFAASPPAVRWPQDSGAHLEHRIEWWYLTGWASDAQSVPRYGFQLTFFRRRLDATQTLRSPLAAKHLIFADVAITDVRAQRLTHLHRMARWSGQPPGQNPADEASTGIGQTKVVLGDWSLTNEGEVLRAVARDKTLQLDLHCTPQQPVLLQGDQGLSRKGPDSAQFSHYYSPPQLALRGQLQLAGQSFELQPGSTGWLDHEWSDSLLHADATGWDWIGINLSNGDALTAFRLRESNGKPMWAGGSYRHQGQLQIFSPESVHFEPLNEWISPLSGARYPTRWRVRTPAGTFTISALVENQEIDSRLTTGAVYWEGLCQVQTAAGGAAGYGYLEMTGYAAALQT